jgi:hypothetical protein
MKTLSLVAAGMIAIVGGACASPSQTVRDSQAPRASTCEQVDLASLLDRPQLYLGRPICFRGPVTISGGVYFTKRRPAADSSFDDVAIFPGIRLGQAIRNGWVDGQVLEVSGVLIPALHCWETRPDGSSGCTPVRRPIDVRDSRVRAVGEGP